MKETMKKNCIVYPYNYEFTPLLRYSEIINEYNLKLVSPKSWGYHGKDASVADEGENLNIVVDSNIKDIMWADIIIISEYPDNEAVYLKVLALIEEGIKNTKEIICLKELHASDSERFIKYSNFKYYSNNETIRQLNNFSMKFVDVPIVCVCGMLENTNKFDVQLAINQYLKKLGYKVSNLTAKSYGKYLGYHLMPKDIMTSSLSINDKVSYINYYISEIEKHDNPDIIIIELPGGIMPYNDDIVNYYGYLHHVFFNAVQCDFLCMNLPYGSPTDEFLEELRLIMKYRFNAPLNCFYFSNKNINKESYLFASEADWMIINKEAFEGKFLEAFSDSHESIFNFCFQNDIMKLGNLLIKSL